MPVSFLGAALVAGAPPRATRTGGPATGWGACPCTVGRAPCVEGGGGGGGGGEAQPIAAQTGGLKEEKE
eukprot:7761920-Pyramimonas_sp.AAC.1